MKFGICVLAGCDNALISVTQGGFVEQTLFGEVVSFSLSENGEIMLFPGVADGKWVILVGLGGLYWVVE